MYRRYGIDSPWCASHVFARIPALETVNRSRSFSRSTPFASRCVAMRSNVSVAPLSDLICSRICSGFGLRRHTILGYSKMHKGVDFA